MVPIVRYLGTAGLGIVDNEAMSRGLRSLVTGAGLGLMLSLHVLLYLGKAGTPNPYDVPLYGIIFFTAPLGGWVGLVSLVMLFRGAKRAPEAIWSAVFYGVGVALILAAASSMGGHFLYPP